MSRIQTEVCAADLLLVGVNWRADGGLLHTKGMAQFGEPELFIGKLSVLSEEVINYSQHLVRDVLSARSKLVAGQLIEGPNGIFRVERLDDEVRRVIQAAPEPFVTILAITAVLGLRIGETLGLRVRDLDFAKRIVRVRQSVDSASRTIGGVKSRASSADKLREKQLHPLLKKLGIESGGFHSLRHGAASALLSASPALVQKQLRHSDPCITLGVYAHVLGDQQRTAAQNRSARLVN